MTSQTDGGCGVDPPVIQTLFFLLGINGFCFSKLLWPFELAVQADF